MKTEYTNKTLSYDYLTFAFRRHIDDANKIAKAIENANVDIAEFYKKNKSLKKMSIKGVGINTKEMLESIIKDGLEGAIIKHDEEVNKRNNERIRYQQVNQIPSERGVDDPARWG